MNKELKFNYENVVKSLQNKLGDAELRASQYESIVIDMVNEKEELLKTIEELKADKK